jgi:hypothetical protein
VSLPSDAEPEAWHEQRGRPHPTRRRPTRSPRQCDYIVSLPVAQFPNMVAVADYYTVSDEDQRFELLIDLFVSGLAGRVEQHEA